ncbi:pantetheine-phosphate adenylyltransferase family protein-like protein [Phyllosticta citrichinensis]|uniref:Pantetheine-phosphate adenylyltransferase family protein-like protein n=1 Tax=Phyllosticta citrichinensis TaxID=1130410 RepID=A0ABR1Y014_9PEZI
MTTPSQALLLLPPPPHPPSFAALRAAYHAPLVAAVRDIRSSPALLEVALPCPHLYGNEKLPRSALYAETQRLVSGLYKLICVLAAQEASGTGEAGGVDARVLLLAYPQDGRLTHAVSGGRTEDDHQGPVINVGTLARSGRPWQTVYAVQTEAGEELLKNFQAAGTSTYSILRVRGGITQLQGQENPEPSSDDVRRHVAVAVGGTFDHLHIGHKLLLTMTAFAVESAANVEEDVQRSITVGITGDELLKNKKHAEFLESWDARQRAVFDFLSTTLEFGPAGSNLKRTEEVHSPGPNGHAINITLPAKLTVKCVEIWDAFGPTITDGSITALVLSGETRSGGKAVNDKRRERGWPDLEVLEVDVLDADETELETGRTEQQNFASKLSSTELRRQQSERAKRTSRV